MYRHVLLLLAVLLISGTGILSGCAAVYAEDPYPPPSARGPDHIPRGHMPPPGMCRIWYPGEPPGQQPSPGDCRDLRHQVPPGAILVEG